MNLNKIGIGIFIGIMVVATLTFANKYTDDNAWLSKDAKGTAVPVAAGFLTQDATGTPQTSPLAVSNSVITIAVPDGAAELVIVHADEAIRVSEIVTVARYFVLPGGFSAVVPVADTDSVYLLRDGSSDSTVQFFFSLLEN